MTDSSRFARGLRRLKEESEGTRSIRGKDIRPRAMSAEVVLVVRSLRIDMRMGFRSRGGDIEEAGAIEEVGGTEEARREDLSGLADTVPF